MARLSQLNPRKLFIRTRLHSYEKLPTVDSQSSSPIFNGPLKSWKTRLPWLERWRRPRMSLSRVIMLMLTLLFLGSMFGTALYRRHRSDDEKRKQGGSKKELYQWEHYPRLTGYWNGVRNLVPSSEWVSEQESVQSIQNNSSKKPVKSKEPPLDPIPFNPYPDYSSEAYLKEHEKVEPCYLDEEGKIGLPDVYAYPGIPQNMTAPFFGSYEELGMDPNVCFERFGRLGPYGYSYSRDEGGLELSSQSETSGVDKIWNHEKKIDYRNVQWGNAQKACYEKNKARFDKNATAESGKKKVPRHAYILRTWTGYKYSDYQILSLRAMINELALKSGGEYDVHFLIHVKDDSIPIWSSDAVYQQTIHDNLPKEFWGMATLWSEQQMRTYYPEPWPNNVDNPANAPVNSVYRSAHFALQWFGQVHPEYDFYWNWEMDLRLSGHYYEFNNRIGEWAKDQPRKGLWERSSRYYIPQLHGSWKNFTDMVQAEIFNSDEKPVWGPPQFDNTGMLEPPAEAFPNNTYAQDNYVWGVGEEADLITFNPIFDPAKTNWVFRNDITGYDTELPEPPRRSAIITVSRLSKRLVDIMHRETYHMKHHAFTEMWPPTIALHHGLKAVYAPHAIYLNHNWPLEQLDNTFNRPSLPTESVFGWGEHNQLGTTFYYNAAFSANLWRRWLGAKEAHEGGAEFEEKGSGRLCIRPILFHPVKFEKGAGEGD
ncbi:hypothetical protein GQ43DRAFT_485314 [Delitschia confertaspora ATCC 74209]|uniref:Major facilitator superfamily transporter n=1 Tax=Delitschia confertaspora ATCC 74209 TaxID=1513339 RepID=A0A9P4JFY1_9PLEO|nr:hypothetical protein GQ43DRAFT_485314 [Delitschia confertaspora ATCC 74209]